MQNTHSSKTFFWKVKQTSSETTVTKIQQRRELEKNSVRLSKATVNSFSMISITDLQVQVCHVTRKALVTAYTTFVFNNVWNVQASQKIKWPFYIFKNLEIFSMI